MNKAEIVFEKLGLSVNLLERAGLKAIKLSTDLLEKSVLPKNLIKGKANSKLFNLSMKKSKQGNELMRKAVSLRKKNTDESIKNFRSNITKRDKNIN